MSGKKNKDKNHPGFSLPAGYFESSAIKILNKAEWEKEHEQYPALQKNASFSPFTVPAEYFQKLEGHLELLPYPLLRDNRKVNPFLLPEDYFQATNSQSGQSISSRPSARVFVLRRRNLSLAVAATLILCLGFWFYNNTQKPANSTLEDCVTIACLDRKELMEAVNLDAMEEAELLDLVNYKELKRALGEHGNNATGQEDSLSGLSEGELLDEI